MIVRQGTVGSQTVFTRPIERQHVCNLSARGRVYETLVESAVKEFGNWPTTGTTGATGSARSKNYRHVAACFLRRARLPFAKKEKHADTRTTRTAAAERSNGGVSNERWKRRRMRKGWSSYGSRYDGDVQSQTTKKRSSAD